MDSKKKLLGSLVSEEWENKPPLLLWGGDVGRKRGCVLGYSNLEENRCVGKLVSLVQYDKGNRRLEGEKRGKITR